MRRPAVVWTANFMGGILLVALKPWWLPIVFIAMNGLLLGKNKKIIYCFMAFVLGMVIMMVHHVDFSLENKSLPKEQQEALQGVVIKHNQEKNQMVVKDEKGKRYLVYLPREEEGSGNETLEATLLTGRLVTLWGRSVTPKEKRNPGGFNQELYLKSQNIQGLFQGQKIKTGDIKNPISYHLEWKKRAYLQTLEKLVGKEMKSLVQAVVFGEKEALDSSTYEVFQANGIAHLLAASGLHVGILYGGLLFFFRCRRSPLFNGMILLILFAYAVLTGFSLSMMRAVIMIALYLFSLMIHRPYDLLSATCATAFFFLLYQPWYLFSLGFQLSFWAMVGICLLQGYLKDVQRRFFRLIFFLLGIQFWMAPVIVYYFHYFSPVAPVTNALMGSLVPLFLMMGLLSFAFFLVFPPSGPFWGMALNTMGELFLFLNEKIYVLSGGSLDMKEPSPGALFLFYGFLLLLFSEGGRILQWRKKRMLQSGLLLVIIGSGIFFHVLLKDPLADYEVIFVDVGQGSSTYIESPEGKTFFIDGGGNGNYDVGKTVLVPFLEERGTFSVDMAIVTHLDQDHYGGLKSLCQKEKVNYLGVSPYCGKDLKTLAKECDLKPNQVVQVKKGDVLYKEKDFSIEVIGPLRENQEGNEGSLVLIITHRGQKILIGGDIGKETEKELTRVYGDLLEATLLVVPHHGSKNSSSTNFIEAVNPLFCVVQVGKNTYGHPNQETIEKYRERDIMVYRTDTMGAIGFDSDTGTVCSYL